MAIRLTPKQEERGGGTDFDGTPEELESLLVEGINSGETQDANETYWCRITTIKDGLLAGHQARKPHP